VVVDTFHHSYSGVRGQENHSLRQTQAKKVCETPSQSGMILCSCGPSYAEGIGRGSQSEAGPRQNHGTVPKK
jgi:hypothetical protein